MIHIHSPVMHNNNILLNVSQAFLQTEQKRCLLFTQSLRCMCSFFYPMRCDGKNWVYTFFSFDFRALELSKVVIVHFCLVPSSASLWKTKKVFFDKSELSLARLLCYLIWIMWQKYPSLAHTRSRTHDRVYTVGYTVTIRSTESKRSNTKFSRSGKKSHIIYLVWNNIWYFPGIHRVMVIKVFRLNHRVNPGSPQTRRKSYKNFLYIMMYPQLPAHSRTTLKRVEEIDAHTLTHKLTAQITWKLK